jgi:hypothetical protein
MFNIQCEDSLINTKLSMLDNLLRLRVRVVEASWVTLDKIVDKQQFKEGVRRDDGVQFYTSSSAY